MSFPAAHRPKLHSTNPIERVNGEIKRRTEVVGIFPNEGVILIGRSRPFQRSATRRK
jgi:transposase-like protein